jgi:serine protease Do
MRNAPRVPVRHLVLLALCFLLLIPSGALAQTPEETPTIRVANLVRPSVVGVLTTLRSGSGPRRPRAAGTGFVYKDGWVMTNAHVVEDGIEVKVLLSDRRVVDVDPETDVFFDTISDIAVIRVDTTGMAALPFARSSELQVGQPVIAVGNPLGFRLGNSVTAGVLSGMGRSLGSGYPFLQIDAPINPGNSGGPLLNSRGEVIGVNSAKIVEIGAEGLGFAIPSDTAKEIADQLIEFGRVERVALGLWLEEGWEALYGIPSEDGLEVTGVVPDGPSGLSGIFAGDKLMKIDSRKLETVDDVTAYLAHKRPGETVVLTINRHQLELTVPVKLVSRAAVRQEAEEKIVERGGILRRLTAAQIQEATRFGERLAQGWGSLPQGYYARSGNNNWATLYTEYAYVARRVQSVYMFGYMPSPGFIQSVAQDFVGMLEFAIELNGDKAEFLNGALVMLRQGSQVRTGMNLPGAGYATATDGSVVIGTFAVRFSSDWFDPAGDLELIVQLADGKQHTFLFKLKDLR